MAWFYFVVRKNHELVYKGEDFNKAIALLPELAGKEKYIWTSFQFYDEHHDKDKQFAIITHNTDANRHNIHLEGSAIRMSLENLTLLIEEIPERLISRKST
ncbi:hypothetical protein HYT57_04010 [Candidatus Woesearchaeota archaeon]|nr:hypothetical protein [Candidatus Woesearchaeota archaeon]